MRVIISVCLSCYLYEFVKFVNFLGALIFCSSPLFLSANKYSKMLKKIIYIYSLYKIAWMINKYALIFNVV